RGVRRLEVRPPTPPAHHRAPPATTSAVGCPAWIRSSWVPASCPASSTLYGPPSNPQLGQSSQRRPSTVSSRPVPSSIVVFIATLPLHTWPPGCRPVRSRIVGGGALPPPYPALRAAAEARRQGPDAVRSRSNAAELAAW